MPYLNEPIHLAIAFDQNYLDPFYALITSIFFHNKNNKIYIHSIATGIPEEEKRAIAAYATKHKSEILFYSLDETLVSSFVLNSDWTPAVYYRLFFPLLIPDHISRLTYIDSDTLVINDLRAFEEVDLEGFPVGAVYDNYVKTAPQLGIYEEEKYFNSGVLVIDIAKWKEQLISEKAFAYLTEFPENIVFVDQDALNAVLKNNWKRLDYKYNLIYSVIPEALPRQAFKSFLADKIIIHFTLHRPWNMLCRNRFRYLYFKYLNLSPKGNKPKYADFSLDKLKKYVLIRLEEFYFDNASLRYVWRRIKG